MRLHYCRHKIFDPSPEDGDVIYERPLTGFKSLVGLTPIEANTFFNFWRHTEQQYNFFEAHLIKSKLVTSSHEDSHLNHSILKMST